MFVSASIPFSVNYQKMYKFFEFHRKNRLISVFRCIRTPSHSSESYRNAHIPENFLIIEPCIIMKFLKTKSVGTKYTEDMRHFLKTLQRVQ